MKKFFIMSAATILLGCSESMSEYEVRDVQNNSFKNETNLTNHVSINLQMNYISDVRIAQVSLECEKIKKNSTTGETISCISAPIQASATISFNQGGIGVNPTLNISSFTASF